MYSMRWPLLIACLLLLCQVHEQSSYAAWSGGPTLPTWLTWSSWRFERDAQGHFLWWQLFMSQLVHLSWPHAWGNAIGAAVLAWCGRYLLPAWAQTVLVVVSACAVAAVLVWDTQCLYYVGASGILHGWFVGLLVWCLFVPHYQRLAAVLLLLVLVKLWVQARWGWSLTLTEKTPLYAPAHVAGALGGALGGVLVRLVCSYRCFALATSDNAHTTHSSD